MAQHERPYKCRSPACEKNLGFTYAGGLLRHQREVHSRNRIESPFLHSHQDRDENVGLGISRCSNLNEHLLRRTSDVSRVQLKGQCIQRPRTDKCRDFENGKVRKIQGQRNEYPGVANPLDAGEAMKLDVPEVAEKPAEPCLVRQPKTRPITEQQLINEVKGIYAGLVMVEKKCIDVVAQQSQSTKRLSDQQWRALVALHRTLLHEHHDFLQASQHPTASDNLKKLAPKYAMPARMWRHGIHAFLELLRDRLPDSMEHMLSFIYLAYSMMALLKESVPSFIETWIECLGDLARYRMAIEDSDPRDREMWSNVAKMWYNEAADKSPEVGRIQHHLAVLARPDIVEQLFYYGKALTSMQPFEDARESIMLPFDMFLENSVQSSVQLRCPAPGYAFINFDALLFTHQIPKEHHQMSNSFALFGIHMNRAGTRSKTQDSEMAAALFLALTDFGSQQFSTRRMYDHAESAVATFSKSDETTEDRCRDDTKSEELLFVRQPSSRSDGLVMQAGPSQNFGYLIPQLISRFGSLIRRSGRFWLKWIAVASLLSPVYAQSAASVSGGDGSNHQFAMLVMFWLMGFLVTAAIPILAHKFPVDNPIATSSIVAFVAALALTIGGGSVLSDVWYALCTGTSLGSSLWLGWTTRSTKNTAITAIIRYAVPAGIVYLTLSDGPSNTNSRLDLSAAVPCLSVFAASALNAFVNEKMTELGMLMLWMWERILRSMGYERRRIFEMA